MVNATKRNHSPPPAGKYSKLTKCSTQRHQHVNEGKSGLDAERVRALGVLCSMRSKKKLRAAKRRETRCLSYEEKVEWIEDYVEKETAVARTRVEDAEKAIKQEQEDMRNTEKAGLTSTKHKTTFEEMFDAIGDSLSNLACSDDGENGQDEDDDEDDSEQGQLSADDKPGWVMHTIPNTVQHCMESFLQKQMKLDKLMHPGCGEEADLFRERDQKYGMTQLKVLAVVQSPMDDHAASSAPMKYGEPMETLDSVPAKSQMLQVTSQPGGSHIRVCAQKPLTHEPLQSFPPAPAPDSLKIQKSKHV